MQQLRYEMEHQQPIARWTKWVTQIRGREALVPDGHAVVENEVKGAPSTITMGSGP